MNVGDLAFVLSQGLLVFLPVMTGLFGMVLERFLEHPGGGGVNGWPRAIFAGVGTPTFGTGATHGLEPVLSVFLRHGFGLSFEPAALLLATLAFLVTAGLVLGYARWT